MTQFLNQMELERKAPSIFTNTAFDKTGSSYELISTNEVLQGLYGLGFGVTHAMESRVRDTSRKGYSRHMLRLRRENEKEVNGFYPEVVLVNSHDGSTSYQLRAGIFRLVCSNGMVVGDEMMSRKVRHQGNVVERVVESCHDIIEVFPTAVEKVQEWQNIKLSYDEQIAYANSARLLKWNEDAPTEVHPTELLKKRRYQDQKDDIWTTFNVIQENLIRGGIKARSKKDGLRRKTRGVSSVYENNRLNTALWTLTEHMASLAR